MLQVHELYRTRARARALLTHYYVENFSRRFFLFPNKDVTVGIIWYTRRVCVVLFFVSTRVHNDD